MKVLLDEMYAGLKEYFEALGYEVLTAQEAGLKGAKDKDVVDMLGRRIWFWLRRTRNLPR